MPYDNEFAPAPNTAGEVRRRAILQAALAVPVGVTLSSALGATRPAHADGSVSEEFIDLGAVLTALRVTSAAVTHNSAGSPLLVAVPEGEDAKINVIDLVTRQLIGTHPMVGSTGAFVVATAADGAVLVGTFTNARLYRYDPVTNTTTDLGQPVPGESQIRSLVSAPDGTIYGGTFGSAHAFSYHPASGTFHDFGSLSSTAQWAGSVAHDAGRNVLYVGLSGSAAQLIRIDLATQVATDVTPPGLTDLGIEKLWCRDDTLFMMEAGKLYAFDLTTMTPRMFVDGTGAQSAHPAGTAVGQLSPAHEGWVYCSLAAGGHYWLWRIRLDDLRVEAVQSGGSQVDASASPLGLGWGQGNTAGVLYGLAGNYTGATFSYDTTAATVDHWTSPLQHVVTALRNVLPGVGALADNIFLSGGANGVTGIYNTITGTVRSSALPSDKVPRVGQVEGWAWRDGRIWAGTYPAATLYEWNPAATANPVKRLQLQASHQQNRPYAVIATEDHIFLGTGPDYGSTEGAFTVYDVASQTANVYRNIVADQTIGSLTVLDGTVYGGSAVLNSNGGTPVASTAKLFAHDIQQQTKLYEMAVIDGANAINCLSVGPDQRIWGMADGQLFALDPQTQQVEMITVTHDGGSGPQEGDAIWHPNGRLYVVSGKKFFEVDPLAGTSRRVHSPVGRAKLSGTVIYLSFQPPGGVGFTHLGSFQPAMGTQLPVDLRRTVTVGAQDSGVANRFLDSGSTLADLVNGETGGDSGARVRQLSATLTRLVQAQVITVREKGILLRLIASHKAGS